jgi:acetone carboxylase gamma subunit
MFDPYMAHVVVKKDDRSVVYVPYIEDQIDSKYVLSRQHLDRKNDPTFTVDCGCMTDEQKKQWKRHVDILVNDTSTLKNISTGCID